jgi:type IV pilus assembly protein PilQ
MDYRYHTAIAPGGASQVRPRRALSLSLAVLAATGGVGCWAVAARAQEVGQAQGAAGVQKGQVLVTTQQLNLRVRRQSDGVEVVIEGVGSAPELQQTTRGTVWLGRLLTSRPAALPGGGQRLSVPEAGFQSLSLVGAGQVFELQVTPIPGYPLGRPVVSADGRDLILSFASSGQASQQTSSLDLRRPGRVSEPTAAYVPPLQPRAVAPPVGDMAVGTMLLTNSSYLNVSGPPVTMTLRKAPARDVLMALSRLGGYGFVFVEDSNKADNAAGTNGSASTLPISISFRNENYGQAVNSALLAAGLQGKRQGNTILAGTNVMGKSFGAQLSKVYRLNQVNANSAADYLANLGAQVTKTNTINTAITAGANPNTTAIGASNLATTTSSRQTKVESYSAGTGPLQGLIATTDSRLSTITLVGEPRLVTVAESYLRQLDLRQRQVALSVKILDITLGNNATIDNSFAFKFGNSFIISESGQLLAQFGRDQPIAGTPPTGSTTTTTVNTSNSGDDTSISSTNTSNASGNSSLSSLGSSNSGFDTSNSNQSGSNSSVTLRSNEFSNFSDAQISSIANELNLEVPGQSTYNPANRSFTFTPSIGTGTATLLDSIASNLQSTITRLTGIDRSNIDTTIVSRSNSSFLNDRSSGSRANNFFSGSESSRSNPSNSFAGNRSTTTTTSTNTVPIGGTPGKPADNFVNFLNAQIVSASTKVLASPTLILSENADELRKGEDTQGINIANLSRGGSGGSGGGGGSSDNNANIGRTKANESFVTVGEQVITNFEVSTSSNFGNVVTCTAELGIAGLTFGARVSKIDDNGFVTFSMSPAITATVRQQEVPGCGFVDILAVRRLDTGSARVRDGQTLIMTGVISDADRQEVTKWPILGDVPVIGQFFRNSNNIRAKRELVILVTPRIINDNEGGTFGYGYQPGTSDSRRLLTDPNSPLRSQP